jgi:hypothetical protein
MAFATTREWAAHELGAHLEKGDFLEAVRALAAEAKPDDDDLFEGALGLIEATKWRAPRAGEPVLRHARTDAQKELAARLDAAIRAVTKAGGGFGLAYTPPALKSQRAREEAVGRTAAVNLERELKALTELAAPPSPGTAAAGIYD